MIIRLGYVQFFNTDELTKKAKDSWSRNIPFEPKRGRILDRHGKVLAGNQTAPTVYVVPRQIKNPKDVAEKLAPILNITVDKAMTHLTKAAMSERINPEGRKITPVQAEKIKALNIKGVYLAEDSIRDYPYGSELAHVLGFAGIDNQGLMGIEQYYDKELKGMKGALQYYSDAKGQRMPALPDDYQKPTDGKDVKLTIDYKIQTIVERELDIATETYHPDSIIAIAMNPKNGEILAMSSRPTFSPSDYQKTDPDVYNRNLPIWSTYEPGSTFKIITLAAALEEKKVDLLHDHFFDSGSVNVAGSTLHCWKPGGHKEETFLEVVQNSCNPGFIELGNRLGKEKLFSYIDSFGFGKKTGIDLNGEGTGIMFKPEQIGPVEQATTAFGQGVAVTPIQQVSAVAAAVNGGVLYQPHIAKEIIDPLTKKATPIQKSYKKSRVISEKTSKEVRSALESVVAQGTGKGAFVDSYRVGGKTGTAQKAQNGRYLENNYIVSFMGFSPSDDPQIVVYVAVDNPKGTVQFGGVVAAPIVGNILRDSVQVLNIPPRKNQIEKKTTYLDPVLVKVPDVVGMQSDELRNQLYDLKVESVGHGKYIMNQTPVAGAKVKAGSTVRLFWGNLKKP